MWISWQHNYLRDPENLAIELCPVKAGSPWRAYVVEVKKRSGSCKCRRKKGPEVLSSGSNVSSRRWCCLIKWWSSRGSWGSSCQGIGWLPKEINSEMAASIRVIVVEVSSERGETSGTIPRWQKLLITWARVMILCGSESWPLQVDRYDRRDHQKPLWQNLLHFI